MSHLLKDLGVTKPRSKHAGVACSIAEGGKHHPICCKEVEPNSVPFVSSYPLRHTCTSIVVLQFTFYIRPRGAFSGWVMMHRSNGFPLSCSVFALQAVWVAHIQVQLVETKEADAAQS